MDNEALIEIIAKRIEAGYIIMSNPENARRDAQAALAAIAEAGYAVVPKTLLQRARDCITDDREKLGMFSEDRELIDALAAALAGRKP